MSTAAKRLDDPPGFLREGRPEPIRPESRSQRNDLESVKAPGPARFRDTSVRSDARAPGGSNRRRIASPPLGSGTQRGAELDSVRWASVMRVGDDAGFPLDGTERSCRSAVPRPLADHRRSRLGSDPLSRGVSWVHDFRLACGAARRTKSGYTYAPRKPTHLSRVAALMVVPAGVIGAQGRSAAANVRVSVTGDGSASRWTSARSVRSEFLCPENHAGRGR